MTFKQTLTTRLEELRKRFIDTQDLVYQVRFNEAKHILELWELDQARRAENLEQIERRRFSPDAND
jgi:hypothetical protein